MLKRILIFTSVLLLVCACAGAEGGFPEAGGYEALNHAFTVLEEGNPFTERYNRVTGQDVRARMAQGAPYFWGAQDDRLFAKEPEYVVLPAWQNSPSYYRAGTNYLYGFDCVGFVRWVWKETFGSAMPKRAEMYADKARHVTNPETDGPLWDNAAELLAPGDLLLLEHRDGGHHMAIYAGTLRMYGYTEVEVPELKNQLDAPLVIHCTTNAQISDRFNELIHHGLPKYRCATVTDGGVCVSLMVPDCENVPGWVHQQNQDTVYYTLPDGTWLTVLSCEDITRYCWYRPGQE